MEDRLMSMVLGAWLAAALGGITGGLAAFLRERSPDRGPLIAKVMLGALLAACSYGAFLLAGAVISLLMFSGAPDPWPALLCVGLGCAAFLLAWWLQPVVGWSFGLPPARGDRRRRTLSDLLDARPRGGRPTMWLMGVGLALLPVIYGIQCLVTQRGRLGTTLWPSAVDGGAAIALGLGWIAVGAFLHFHFFFGMHPGLSAHSRPGKRVALIAACAGLSTAVVWSVVSKLP
jgi:hypothetical protein